MNILDSVGDLSVAARFVSPDGVFQIDCSNVNRMESNVYKVARLTNLKTGQVIDDAWGSSGDVAHIGNLIERLCHWSGYELSGSVVGFRVSCSEACGFLEEVAYMNQTVRQKCPDCKKFTQVEEIFVGAEHVDQVKDCA